MKGRSMGVGSRPGFFWSSARSFAIPAGTAPTVGDGAPVVDAPVAEGAGDEATPDGEAEEIGPGDDGDDVALAAGGTSVAGTAVEGPVVAGAGAGA